MSQVETTMKNGMLYEVLTVEKYKKLKKEGVTDNRIMRKFGYNNVSLSKWKKENLTKEEIEELSLKKSAPKKMPEVYIKKAGAEKKVIAVEAHQKVLDELKQKNKDIENMELAIKDLKEQLDIAEDEKGRMRAEHEEALQEFASEKELAYQEAKEWHAKYHGVIKELNQLKNETVQNDYRIQNLEFLLAEAEKELAATKKEIEPLKKLLLIYLGKEQKR